jgi:hypothetical protein
MSEHAQVNQPAEKQQTQSPVEEVAGYGSSPVAASPLYDMLQQSIGNRALGRLMESQRAASKEAPTPVSPEKQREIDATRGDGIPFEGAPGVRMHYGENAQALARGLNARAFTQGKDIFFGENYDPNSEAGQNTLAHELTHAANGQAMAGAVQREGEGATPPANAPAEKSTDPKGEDRYTLTLSDGIRDNLTKDQAMGVLNDAAGSQERALSLYSGEWAEVNKGRLSFFDAIGGALVDLAGQNFPSYEETWKDADNAMIEVRKAQRIQDVKSLAENLKTAHDAYKKGNDKWSSYKTQLDSAALKAQVGIVVVAVIAVVVIATGGAAAAALAPEAGVGAGGAAGAGGLGVTGAGGGVGAGGGIAGGTTAVGTGTGVAAGTGTGGTVVMGGAPTIAAGAGGTTAAAGAGGGTVVMGGAPTIAAGAGGAGAGGGAVVGATTGGGAVVGGGVGGSIATGATIPAAAGTIAGVTEGGLVAEETARAATGLVIRTVAAEGATGGTAVAQGMSVWTLEAVMARLSILIGANAPLASKELDMLKLAFDVVNAVWKGKAGLPGPPGP